MPNCTSLAVGLTLLAVPLSAAPHPVTVGGGWILEGDQTKIVDEENQTMEAYRTEAKLEREGELRLSDLPFHAGDEVEVIVLRQDSAQTVENPYPLRGLPIRYEDPTEPVAESDWDALK